MNATTLTAAPPPVAPAPSYPPDLSGPGVLQLAEYWLAPDRFIHRCIDGGDRFTFRFPGTGPVVGLTSPQDIKRLHSMPPGSVELASIVSRFFPHHVMFGKDNLIGMDGQPHIRARRLVSPPLHGDALRGYQDVMVTRTQQELESWPWGTPVSLRDRMGPVALDIVMSAVFGITDGERLTRVRDASIEFLGAAFTKRFMFDTVVATLRGGNWKGNYDYLLRKRHAVEAIIREEVAERERTGDLARTDVLALLMATRDEDGAPMPENAMLESLVGLLTAGYETTATTLGWLGALLTREPDVIAKLERAVAEDDDLYVDAVIMEAMRLRPPGVFTFRKITRPLDLGDIVLPADTIVAPMLAAMQRRPDIYPDPERFDPDRFPGAKARDHTWLTFGGGTRRCLGAAFATVELRLILKTIVQHAHIRPSADPREGFKRNNFILIPDKGGLVVLDKRA